MMSMDEEEMSLEARQCVTTLREGKKCVLLCDTALCDCCSIASILHSPKERCSRSQQAVQQL